MDADDPGVITMRKFIRQHRTARREQLQTELTQAQADARRVIAHIIEHYAPKRIYQWGSVIDGAGFQAISDIDIAVEGVADPRRFFALLGECEPMAARPLHIVRIEDLHPLYRSEVVDRGVCVYER